MYATTAGSRVLLRLLTPSPTLRLLRPAPCAHRACVQPVLLHRSLQTATDQSPAPATTTAAVPQPASADHENRVVATGIEFFTEIERRRREERKRKGLAPEYILLRGGKSITGFEEVGEDTPDANLVEAEAKDAPLAAIDINAKTPAAAVQAEQAAASAQPTNVNIETSELLQQSEATKKLVAPTEPALFSPALMRTILARGEPEIPLEDECCGRGCANCVYIVYAQEVEDWELAKKWDEKYHQQAAGRELLLGDMHTPNAATVVRRSPNTVRSSFITCSTS